MADTHLFDVTRVIQLAVAPVFLLTAVGTIINVLTNRLSRAVDRSRVLEERLADQQLTWAREELGVLARRIRLVYIAIVLAVVCALLICMMIASAFIGAFVSSDLAHVVGALFIAAMGALTGALLVFLREIFLAVLTARRAIP